MSKLVPPQSDTATRTANTPEDGELLYDTDEQQFYQGDGSTTGGIVLGGGGYSTIQNEGTPVAQESVIDFQGAGVTATAGTGKTIVTVPGGGGGGVSTIQGATTSLANGEEEILELAVPDAIIATDVEVDRDADVNFYARYSSTPSVSNDPFFNYVIFHADGEGVNGATAFTEESFIGAVATFNGNAELSNANPNLNATTSFSFDGSGDSVTFPANSAFDLESSNFTLEAWVRPSSIAGTDTIFGHIAGVTPINGYVLILLAGIPTFNIYNNSPGPTLSLSATTTLTINTWNHIAVTRNGDRFAIFVNGVAENTGTLIGGISTLGATKFPTIGAWQDTTGREFDGLMEGLRLTLFPRYNADFSVPTQPFPVVLETNFDPIFNYVILHADGEGTNGATAFTSEDYGTQVAVFNGTSQLGTTNVNLNATTTFELNGSGNIIEFPNNDIYNFGLDPFTIEWWAYRTSGTGASMSYHGNGAFSNGGWAMQENGDFSVATTGGSLTNHATGFTFPTGSWEQYSIDRDKDGNLTFAQNGAVTATTTDTTDIAITAVAPTLLLGARRDGVSGLGAITQEMTGSMEGVRITRGENRYPVAYPVPAAVFPATLAYDYLYDSVPLLLIGEGTNGQTAYTSEDKNARVLTPVGDAQLSNSNPNVNATTSFSFDGTGDYYDITFFSLPTTGFTIECWVYRNVAGADHCIFSNYAGSSDGIFLQISSTNTVSFGVSGDGALVSIGTVPATTWAHLAAVYDGAGGVRIYINGTLDNTGADTLSLGTLSYHFGKFRSVIDRFFNGLIENFRITEGERYTADFIPPAAPLPTEGIPEATPGGTSFYLVETVSGLLAGVPQETKVLTFNKDTGSPNMKVGVVNNGTTGTVTLDLTYIPLT